RGRSVRRDSLRRRPRPWEASFPAQPAARERRPRLGGDSHLGGRARDDLPRETRTETEGSPQRASADAPMKSGRRTAMLRAKVKRSLKEPRPRRKEFEMRKGLEIGGAVAAAILVASGIAAIVMGVNGRSTVRDSLKLEQIVGSPDMTP